MSKQKVVVTGGAGFLGSHVVGQLLDDGHAVVVLDDFSNGKEAHLATVEGHPNLQIIHGDITRRADVKTAFAGCDWVIHLAVLDLRQSIKEPERVNQVIVDGTMNCLAVARENQMQLFLNCSSSEAYGSAAYVPMDEKHPLHPETPYAAAKVAQDMYVYSYGRTYGLPWTTIRPFNMYGPNSHWQGFRGELIPKMIVRAMNKQPLVLFGDGEQTRDFLYVEEAASAVIDVAKNPDSLGRTMNFCTGKETSVRQIAEIICQQFGLDPATAIEKQAARPGDVMRHLGDNRVFQEIVGYAPQIEIEEGIVKTIQWLQSLPFSPEELLSQEVLRSWE
ncbi:GDP-mannose 4,6-dehydratase [Candidatus Venteria ishoeyi]|uniref:UDP-glucose 4-epimerase n=1 Tax=Candidatus Venteria ishoeyi TaxID=1899563 RepID=A0A1H6F4W7_9GAMM|nr:GDP-mannose 4,6-dehydratase [Candidatus Venteria ishoeyi]MDM8547727.1 GDP-mannose 4,6-dehydratase [Candidatus Venteria ishoeyi]SEH04421.1 UDP-glucose 4-epimerase [Candidatus Venteria ishoeyi]